MATFVENINALANGYADVHAVSAIIDEIQAVGGNINDIQDIVTAINDGSFADATNIVNMNVATGAVGSNVTWDGTTLTIPRGDVGPQGEQGIQGIQGEIGPMGARGEQGIQGIKGDKGDKGDTGNTGLSAYEVAVSEGFVGTQDEWLQQLNYDYEGIKIRYYEFIGSAGQLHFQFPVEDNDEIEVYYNGLLLSRDDWHLFGDKLVLNQGVTVSGDIIFIRAFRSFSVVDALTADEIDDWVGSVQEFEDYMNGNI